MMATSTPEPGALRVAVVGSGTQFLSGISYYTLRLANAFATRYRTSAILMRQLIPTRLYPGHARVGAELTTQRYESRVRVFDGVNWYWLPSIFGALRRLVADRPDVIVFQWWSGSVLHSYVALAVAARLLGAQVVVEFHEVLDTAEAKMPVIGRYVTLVAPLLMRLASGFVVHSSFDLPAVRSRYRLGRRPVAVIPHGPYEHHRAPEAPSAAEAWLAGADAAGLTTGPFHLLSFGVIRPFKGVEDLIAAFDAIPSSEIDGYRLTVIGETWEGWTAPAEAIAASPYGDRITFINRYVTDAEVAAAFAAADAVVLPYHRSSASGPLHTAMSHGLPVIVTAVGGLVEAAADYAGAIFVPAADPAAITAGIRSLPARRGQRYPDPHSWAATLDRYEALFARLPIRGRSSAALSNAASPAASGDITKAGA